MDVLAGVAIISVFAATLMVGFGWLSLKQTQREVAASRERDQHRVPGE